jgi:hypothetical protein
MPNAILENAEMIVQASAQAARALNTRRQADVPEEVRRLSVERQVYIGNVGPWQQEQWLGTMGRAIIRACPKDAEYYPEPYIVEGIPREQVIMNESAMTLLMYNRDEHAQAILGIGKHMHAGNSLEQFGVFISECWPPEPDTIANAKARLMQTCRNLVNEANAALAMGPKMAEETIRADQHFVAARLLGLTDVEAPFLQRSVVAKDRIACPFCGESMGAGLPKCPNCKEVVNQAAYKAAQQAAREG